MNKKRKLCQEYNVSIQTINMTIQKININSQKINKLKKIIKKLETEMIMNEKCPHEFLWNLTINRKYKNTGDKMILYHEPDKATFLDKFIEKNETFIINTMYYDDDGVRWFKLLDGRGWIIK